MIILKRNNILYCKARDLRRLINIIKGSLYIFSVLFIRHTSYVIARSTTAALVQSTAEPNKPLRKAISMKVWHIIMSHVSVFQ